MPTDSSNARHVGDAADPAKGSEGSSSGVEAQSGKTPQARPLGEAIGGPDPADEIGAALAQLEVGSIVDGRYRVDQVLGRGAMGVVVQATHQQLGERVALKFLRYRAKGNVGDDFQSRFKREAKVSARLKNEHITRVIDVGMWRDKVPYMVMDHLTGTDLRQVIRGGEPIPVPVAIDYTVQVCEGIAEAHANGVVHRDLKPSNLFLTKRPDGSDLVKILDFGISKWTADETEIDELTQTGVVLGSPKYMAPEQLFGSSEVDSRADVWSVGAILYEMLAGRPPFDLPTFTKICAELATDRPPPSIVAKRPEVPMELEAAVMRCFARSPANRIPNVAELAGAVLDAVQAPFADAVRSKILATLDPKAARGELSTTGNRSMGSGAYAASLSGSSPSARLVFPPPPTTASTETAAAAPTSVSGPQPAHRRSRTPWIVLGAVVLAAGGALLAFSGSSSDDRSKAAHDRSAATVSSPEPLPPTTAAATTAVTATPTPTVAPTVTPAPSPVASVTAAPPTPAPPVHAPWRANLPRWNQSNLHEPPPASTGNAAPPATTAAPPATAPAPQAGTAKPDPLGDRQ